MKARFWKLFAAVLVVSAVSVPFLVAYRHRHAADLFQAKLRAQGQFRTVAEARPALRTNLPNGGPALTNLMTRLPVLPVELAFGAVTGLPAGKRCVRWAQAELPTPSTTNLWPPLRAFLSTNAAGLTAVRAACEAPVIEFAISYEDSLRESPAHLTQAKPSIQLLAADARLALHDGDPARALADVRAGLQFTARWNREPLLTSQYVRLGMATTLADVTWDLLQRPGWTDAELASLQVAWQEVDLAAGADAAIEMEQALAVQVSREWKHEDFMAADHAAGGGVHSGFVTLATLALRDPDAAGREIADQHVLWWLYRSWRRYDLELANLHHAQALRAACRRAAASGAWWVEHQQVIQTHLALCQSVYAVPSFVPLGCLPWGDLVAKYASMITQRELMITAIALERFRLRHGAYPERLDALLPEFLPKLPTDCMVGQPLRYRLNAAGDFTLYSVGQDRRDDDGDPSPAGSATFWASCKDIVWPRPASPVEVEAALAQVRKTVAPPPAAMTPEMAERFRRRYGIPPPAMLPQPPRRSID